MPNTAADWCPAPVLDPERIQEHLAQHGVFDAVDEFYRKVDAGEPLGDVMSPDEVRQWLADRCAR